jgi:hypothetical protein
MIRLILSPWRVGIAVLLLAAFAAGVLALPERAPAAIDPDDDAPSPSPAIDTEMEEETDTGVAPSPSPQVDVRLVGMLARGMRHIKQTHDGGKWYFCGERLTDSEKVEISTAIAYHLVNNLKSVGIENVSPWGIVATAYNESKLDACALGIGPRKWAYRKGLLQPRRTTISHTRDEVLRIVRDRKARARYALTGFDLGLCQVLSRFYPDQDAEMLSISGGMRICVLEMQARARQYKTSAPWLFWRGSRTAWYRKKIRRWARIMGAPVDTGII